MVWQANPYVLPLLFAAVTALILALRVWQRRPSPGTSSFTFLLVGSSIWLIGYAFQLLSVDLSSKVFWAKLQTPGNAIMSALFLVFAMQYTGRDKWLTRPVLAVLVTEPLLRIALTWTNEYHQLIWRDVQLTMAGALKYLSVESGAWAILSEIYRQGLILGGLIFLVTMFARAPHVYRRQLAALLLGVGTPIIVDWLALLDRQLFAYIDPTPFTLAFTGLVLYWGFFQLRLLDVVPIAREAIIEDMSDGVIVLDIHDRIVDLNPVARSLLGKDLHTVIGTTAAVAFAAIPGMSEWYAAEHDRILHIEQENGETRHYDLRVSPIMSRNNTNIGSLVILHDSTRREVAEQQLKHLNQELAVRVAKRTAALADRNEQLQREVAERRRIERELRENQARFQQLAENINEAFWLIDARTRELLYVSPAYRYIWDVPEHEASISLLTWLRSIIPDDRSTVLERLRGVLDKPMTFEYRIRRNASEIRWIQTRTFPIQDESGMVYRVAGIAEDITDRKRAEEQLVHEAYHDELTGLPNRSLFMERLWLAVHTARNHDISFAVLFLDLDRFKVVNDSLGHRSGDALLIELARRLTHCLRPSDTIARLGGDEFIVLLDNNPTIEEAVAVAERLQQRLRRPFKLDTKEVFVSASIGIVPSTPAHTSAEDILRDADIALYRAKSLGKARYEIFDETLRRDAELRLELETDLRRALDQGQFNLRFQPIISLATGQITAFEALARWEHSKHGTISPARFVPIAEETGLIIRLDHWVLREACRQLHRWQQAGAGGDHLSVSVNLSGYHFSQPTRLVETIETALIESDLDPRRLKIEITESRIMSHADITIAALERLKDIGVQIYIDDFGTGYSSLSYLHRFPIDALKIDRSFISRSEMTNDHVEIIRTIIALAKELDLNVVAEGIETVAQLHILQSLECTEGQGYLFSTPLSPDKATALLSTAGNLLSTPRTA